jgi:hypothetical protein
MRYLLANISFLFEKHLQPLKSWRHRAKFLHGWGGFLTMLIAIKDSLLLGRWDSTRMSSYWLPSGCWWREK